MKITFPHLGNAYIIAKSFFDDLGLDYVIPPFNSKKALEIGTRHVPELACLPLKLNIGNYLQARDQGADTILMLGGCGPCRFGYYCEMQKEILHDIGCDMDIITLEAPYGDWGELWARVKKLVNGAGLRKTVPAARNIVRTAVKVDELERLVFRTRPREAEKGRTDEVYRRFKEKALQVKGSRNMLALMEKTMGELGDIELNDEIKPLRIGIVGEIYTTIEQFASFDVQQKLGHMGAEVDRQVTLSGWVIEHMLKKALHLPRDLRYAEAAKPYLGAMIGGHAQETIGNTVLNALDGYDGVVQIYPFSCMPEIVAEGILPVVEREMDIPVLTIIIDEMTGEAGCMTRLEAFIDLLERRREAALFEEGRILPGY
jgi:predicted nucleotide-binding protein (sugar kinase/HSP70/actin superfamily)